MKQHCWRIYYHHRFTKSLCTREKVFKTKKAAQEYIDSLWEGGFPELVESIRRERI